MKIKESDFTILLLGLLFTSVMLKKNEVLIPDNYISIIDDDEIPIFRNPLLPDKDLIDNPNLALDTTTHIISDKNSNFGRKWMKRYRSGIIFKFYPP